MENLGMKLLLADRQDITRAGLLYLASSMNLHDIACVDSKEKLIGALDNAGGNSVVVLDYTLFDIRDIDELFILHERFLLAHWILFSDELSPSFVRRLLATSDHFSVVSKDSPLQEISEALRAALDGHRFICQQTAGMLAEQPLAQVEQPNLTKTEVEVLRCIALGMTTREIAEKRFSSFHTVNTHRKNIFRKLGVNNVHEAIKYALRAGLVDSAEYYI